MFLDQNYQDTNFPHHTIYVNTLISYLSSLTKQPVFDLQKSFHQGGTIKDITDQICSLNADLSSYDSPTQLVVDKYMREHGLEVEPEEEEFGYGKLVIDYKPPKKSAPSISSKGKEHSAIYRSCD